jgi:PAS domain S-box-containing protein
MADIPEINRFYQSSPTPAWLATRQGHCVYANPALERFTGLIPEQIKQSDWRSFLLDEDRAIATAGWETSIANRTLFRTQARMRRFDGVPTRVELIAFGHKVDDGTEFWLFTGLPENDSTRQHPPSEAQIQATLNVIPAYTFYTDPSGALTFVNERLADYLGLPKGHSIRSGIATGAAWDSHLHFVHPEEHEETRKVWSTCLRTGCAGQTTFRVRNAEGKYRWFLSRAEPLRANDGNVQYWIGVNLDIDDKKRAEDALRKSEKELRDVIDTIPAVVWSALPDGSSVYVNRRFVECSGMPVEETAGSGWQAAIHPDDFRQHIDKWMASVATGEPFENELRFRHSDGQYRWHLDRGVPLRDEDGNIIRWYGVVTDIEDRKCAEDTLQLLSHDLQNSKARLEEAQHISHVGYWVWDLDTSRLTWSDETYRIFGLRPQERQLDIPAFREMLHPEDHDFVLGTADEALRGKVRPDIEHRIVRPSGEVRIVHSQGDVRRDASGRAYQLFGTIQDITERKHAEEALQRTQHYLDEAQRLAHMGSWAFNAAGFEYWSPELFHVHGLDSSGRPPTAEEYLLLIHPEDRESMRQEIKNMLTDHRAFDYTKRIVRADGEIRYVRCVGTPMTQGEIFQRFVGTGMDVTEQVRLTEHLRRNEGYLREGQRLAHMGSWAFNPSGFFDYWSDDLYQIYGLDPRQGPPTLERYLATLHPQDRDFMAETIKTMHLQWVGCDVKKRIVRPNGEQRYIRCVGIPVIKEEVLTGFFGTAIDITEQELLLRELERRETYLAEAQTLSQTGSWAWSPVSDNTYYSQECSRLLGFDPLGPTPPLASVIQRIHPDDQARCRELVEKGVPNKQDFELEYRIIHPDKGIRDIHCVCHPVLDQSGDLIELVGTVIDITERKRSEQEHEKLRQLEAELAHTNRVSMLGEMAASLAHEIKQPIAAAVNSANSCIEWLAHEPPNLDRARAAAFRIDKYGNRAARIIDHIRSLYKKSPSQRERVDVNGIVHEIFTLLQGEATRSSVAVSTELDAELPTIEADRVQLQQVFMNLMLNAIEAMQDSGGKLTIRSQVQDERLLFSVIDTGVGLPSENVDQVFSAFFTTKPQGSGMGLAISRSIVESHGGQLWASANEGHGAIFYFTLPNRVTV